MPSLTIKGMPDTLYQRLRERAAYNRRSLNAEVIVALEEATGLREDADARIMRRIEARRSSIPAVDHAKTQEYREWGRG
jgi:antitoxin FitA